MYRSALVRDKWELRGDYYLPRTILRSCSVSTEVAKGRSEPLPPPPNAEAAEAAGISIRADGGGLGIMGTDGQLSHFETSFYDRRRLPVGQPFPGPAIVLQSDSTTVIPPGATAEVHPTGSMIITLGGTA